MHRQEKHISYYSRKRLAWYWPSRCLPPGLKWHNSGQITPKWHRSFFVRPCVAERERERKKKQAVCALLLSALSGGCSLWCNWGKTGWLGHKWYRERLKEQGGEGKKGWNAAALPSASSPISQYRLCVAVTPPPNILYSHPLPSPLLCGTGFT